ncbi:hypothetical protein [Saccharicrinis sp. GN24d3]|uniref:hypothetical protein n=1 Tax=Saccharicrinis sp. GN24d3 TaxID=3458416 RepID=UPI004035E9D0
MMSRIKHGIYILILIFASLTCSSNTLGQKVLIYCSSDIPAVHITAVDLQQSLKGKGLKSKIAPISKLSAKQDKVQIVIGLQTDETLLKQLQVAGGKNSGELVIEGYAIGLTQTNNHLTILAIGADAIGTMYAGLSRAETIAQDGINQAKRRWNSFIACTKIGYK